MTMLEQSSPREPATTPLPYQDAALPVAARVADLLARMTREEKAAQMVGVWQQKADTLVDDAGDFDLAKARGAFADGHGLGQVGRPSDAGGSGSGGGGHDPLKGRDARQQAVLTNAIQKFFLEESRLGIPVIFHEECLHGQAAKDGTSFPQPIGLAATFDPALVERLYAMVAHEARVRGTHQALTPVVDVARDPRWGRVRRRSARTRTSLRAWGSPRCAASRGTRASPTRRRSSPRSSTSSPTGSPRRGRTAPRST
jgi:beta-glucosidase